MARQDVGTLAVQLVAETSGFSAGMKQAQRDMQGTQKVSRELKSGFTALSREGLQVVEQMAPRAAGALGTLQGAMTGLLTGGLIGGAIGGTIALVNHLQAVAKEAEETGRKIEAAQARSLRSARESQLEIQRLQAEATGDPGKGAEAAHAKTVQLARLERDEKLRLAQETVKHAQQLEIEQAAIQRKFAGERMVADQQLANERLAIQKKAAEERSKAFEKEVEEMQRIQDLIRDLSAAAQTAAHDRAIAEGTASGDVFKVLDAETAKRRQEIAKTAQAQLDALTARAMTEKEFASARDLIWQTSRDQQFAADTKALDAWKAAIATLTSDTKNLLSSVGPGFEELTEKLATEETVQKSAKDFQTLANAFTQGLIPSAGQAAELVRRMTENLQAEGATIAQIGAVVPDTLKTITSLFRDQQSAVSAVEGAVEGTVADLARLGTEAAPGLQAVGAEVDALTGSFQTLAQAAHAARTAILSVPSAPGGGGGGTPGGSTDDAEARTARARQVEDDERRGLY